MRAGWLADQGETIGGAEFTQAEFLAAAPDGVEIIYCAPGNVTEGLDLYVIQNCVMYPREDLERIDTRAIKYWHDVGPHLQPGVRDWLDVNAEPVCCSPTQAEYMGIRDPHLIPPPVDLDRFRAAGDRSNGNRAGAVCVGSWRNYGKAPHRVLEWATRNGHVDFYGGGVFAPAGSREVAYADMPQLLARYRTLVFLPTVIEPFGRVVAEAWASGCEVVTNHLVGAKWWITENPEALDTAAADFWALVIGE